MAFIKPGGWPLSWSLGLCVYKEVNLREHQSESEQERGNFKYETLGSFVVFAGSLPGREAQTML